MYRRDEYLNSDDCEKQCMARDNLGLDWNVLIAKRIDRDLHEKLLAVPADKMMPFLQILPLISSGYLDTARSLVESAEVDDTLADIKKWLLAALEEADDIGGQR